MLFLLIPLIYLIIGTIHGRNGYAKHRLAILGEDAAAIATRAKASLDNISHGGDCWRGPRHKSTSHDCDCSRRKEWKALTDTVAHIASSGVVPRNYNLYAHVLAWPVLGYHAFLTGKPLPAQPVRPDYELIAAREKELLSIKG